MNNYLKSQLSASEFTSSLRKGMGRAYLHVNHFGLDSVADIVLESCLHNQEYDPQTEPARADWLFSMFRNTQHYQRFHDKILLALQSETNPWDLLQLCQLTKIMAELGDTNAQESLKEFVFRTAQTPSEYKWLGVKEWIDYAGSDGLIDLAIAYGKRLLSNPEDWVNEDLLLYHDDPEDKKLLLQKSMDDPAIKAYIEYLEQKGRMEDIHPETIDREKSRQDFHKRVRKEYKVEDIIKKARAKKGKFPSNYVIFGRHATEADLITVFDQILKETDEDVITRLLWVFRRAQLPKIENIFFLWADGPNEPLRRAAIAALVQTEDVRVHEFARMKIREGKLTGADQEAIDLFLKNYDTSDAKTISLALPKLEALDTDDTHRLTLSISRLAELQQDPELSDALKWVYEETPCTICRYSAVKQLAQFDQLEDAILYECGFDSGEDIRNLARKSQG